MSEGGPYGGGKMLTAPKGEIPLFKLRPGNCFAFCYKALKSCQTAHESPSRGWGGAEEGRPSITPEQSRRSAARAVNQNKGRSHTAAPRPAKDRQACAQPCRGQPRPSPCPPPCRHPPTRHRRQAAGQAKGPGSGAPPTTRSAQTSPPSAGRCAVSQTRDRRRQTPADSLDGDFGEASGARASEQLRA